MAAQNKTPKKAAFLAAYAACGVVSQASEASGVGRSTHYAWMRADEEYRKQFHAAQRESCAALEEEARRRAVEGWDEPVFYEGVQCGVKRKYSDACLIFLLKGNNPAKFGDKIEQKHTGSIAQPVQFYLPEGRRQYFHTNGNGSSN